MRARSSLFPFFVVVATLTAGDAGTGAREEVVPAATPLADYVELIEELDRRRRVNVLYPNPQSLFDGLQAGFVNVTAGNLSFRRRDLVVPADGPLAFARVHDSRIEANRDFGPRWRLSLAEELLVQGDGFVYIDRAGARHAFAPAAHGYVADPPTPRHARTRLEFADGAAVLREADGTKRVFEPVADGGRYVVASVASGVRRLDFAYAAGLLVAVVHDGRTLFDIDRRPDGTVAAVADAHGRTVRYSYAGGLLKDVIDLAGNVWWHEYDAAGRLTTAVGANRRPYLRVRYDERGRVAESLAGREYAYAYSPGRTTVTEGSGVRHEFGHDAAGATDRLTSTNGADWRLRFDPDHRVRKLDTRDDSVAFSYTAAGALASMVGTVGGVAVEREYDYDEEERLVAAEDLVAGERTQAYYADRHVHMTHEDARSAGEFSYESTDDGEVSFVRDGAVAFDIDRDRAGDVTALHSAGRTVRFARDRLGRIVDAEYPDGSTSRYFHDALGNRRLVEHGAGGAVRYGHDAAGNIVEVEVTELDGTTKRQTVTVGDMNRVERIDYEGSYALDVDYDGMGRPAKFDTGSDEVTVEYTSEGRLSRLRSSATGEVLQFGGRGRVVGPSAAVAPRLAALSRDGAGDTQPSYGVLRFAEATFDASPRDPAESGVPGLVAARALAAVARPLFADGAAGALDFEKPSNPVFQPAEYRSTNCCAGCTLSGLCDVCGGQNLPGLCYCAVDPEVGGGRSGGSVSGGGGGGESGQVPAKLKAKDISPKLVADIPRGEHNAWGSTRVNFEVAPTCDGSRERFYLSAKVSFTPDTKITIATRIPVVLPRCTRQGVRNAWNRAWAMKHERKHAEAFVGRVNSVIDQHKHLFENEYDTLQACRAAGSRFKKAVTDGHKDELGRQRRHEDHKNKNFRKHAAYCPSGHTVSAERECDGENVECPGGNTY